MNRNRNQNSSPKSHGFVCSLSLSLLIFISLIVMMIISPRVCDGSSLFWTWGPGGGLGKGNTKGKHMALWVHPVYFGQTFPEFGGPPRGIPVYRDYIVRKVPTSTPQPEITYTKLKFETTAAPPSS